MVKAEEESRRGNKRLLQEEEEEYRQIREHYLRLEYMYENCTGYDQHICRLIEEQQRILDDLNMKKREFADAWYC